MVVSKVKKAMSGYSKLKEAKQISKHFSDYLSPVVAASQENKSTVFKEY